MLDISNMRRMVEALKHFLPKGDQKETMLQLKPIEYSGQFSIASPAIGNHHSG